MELVKPPLKQPSLPLYLTSFVGRFQEQAILTTLLLDSHLLTLVGAGGIGKTRLALHLATETTPTFSDGVFLIELASLSEPEMVLQAVASALSIPTNQDTSLLSLLLSTLQDHHCLLLFDNCEHVLEACKSLITDLLRACPSLRILTTSREPLHIEGETVWRVTVLSYPQPERVLPLEELAQYEAIQLFCQRASETNPSFRLTAQNASTVVHICQELDGIPLALELAAARLSMLSLDQLAARLHERFALLTDGERTAASHQHTLRATLDWSYALLTPPEQALFQRLAIFSDSWNLEAIEQVIDQASIAPYASSDVLTHLVNKSLVIAEEQERHEEGKAEIRFRLLNTVQQYALEKGRKLADWPQVCEKHTTWYLHLAEEASSHFHDAEQLSWLRRLEADMPNVQAVLTRLLASRDIDTCVRLAEAVSRYWIIRNRFSEGRYWFEALLTQTHDRHDLSPLLQARALFGAAEFARYQGAYERAYILLEEQIALLQTLDDPFRLAEAQAYLGTALAMRGEYKRAQQLCQASLDFYREQKQGSGIVRTLIPLSFIALGQGKYLRAITLSEEACTLLRRAGDYGYLLYALFPLAQATILQSKLEQARTVCQEALDLSQQLKQPFSLAASLGLIGGIASLQGQMLQAARLFGAAQALQERAHTPFPPSGQALQERMIFLVRSSLGKDEFLLHYTDGQNTTLEQALAEAETVLQAPPPHLPSEASDSLSSSPRLATLSPREREILALVATGLSDTQIAKRLLISRYTVNTHLQSIYTKLHISSRSAATRLALEHGLV